MTDKYYDVYFEPADLYVDQEGHLENPDALQIIEFEYADEESDEATACRRVDEKGNVLEDPWKNREYAETWGMVHVGDGDDPSIDKALGRFEGWLTDNLEWRESYRGDYYNPPEYVCVGITGYVDEPPYRPHRISKYILREIMRKKR